MNVDVLVVGAGPAGLSAAVELKRLGVGRVLVVEREREAGGVPRHSWHTGYGLRDLHRILSGPAYARTLIDAALRAGVEIRTSCTVIGLSGADQPKTGPAGTGLLGADESRGGLSATGLPDTSPFGAGLSGSGLSGGGLPDTGPSETSRSRNRPAETAQPGTDLPETGLPESAPSGADLSAAATLAGRAGLTATVTSPRGVETVTAVAVLLATGCRERPRSARLVPGDRPPGVMTTGELQQRVYLGGERISGRAVVVGAEHVSFSAAATLTHAGARVVALVTEHERHQSYGAFRVGAALRWRVPVWTSSVVSRVIGAQGRLTAVEVGDVRGGNKTAVHCEVVVFTGDWIPDHALARDARLAIDPGTLGPAVDTALATSADGVFAGGNLVHAAETADVAALSGRHAARQAAGYLAGRRGGAVRVPVAVAAPLTWISPNAVAVGTAPPRGRFTLRAAEFRRSGRLEVRQGGCLLARSRPRRLIPGRAVYLGTPWLGKVNPAGGPVLVTYADR